MAKTLVIVESPTKAKTISKILGRNYKVIASVGHLRDLPKSRMGINIDGNFEPEYINVRGKGPIINEIKKEAKKVDQVYLATDPDREGEAISWHLNYLLGLDENTKNRVVFQEITKVAVLKAIKNPRKIDMNLVDAQQARRVLDRIVGYKLSPLLWKTVKSGLSAGRVQSVALKLICDREEEIRKFIKEEYWSIHSLYCDKGEEFVADLKWQLKNNKKVKIDLKNSKKADLILDDLKNESHAITDIEKSKKVRNPYSPFTTSTLQQDAYSKLGFSTGKTMTIAQQLYEGITIGKEGSVGLITYMRTDSTRISAEFISNALKYIGKNIGEDYLTKGRQYGKQKKGSQDAHEGIRPTDSFRSPNSIKGYLNEEQFKLYRLIWSRTLASQMKPAIYQATKIITKAKDYIFQANGMIEVFDGFTKIYKIGDNSNKILPELELGQELNVKNIYKEQHFTKPKPRYTEASLVKKLEEDGIGRPSTYASTISSLKKRNYVEVKERKFYTTKIGENVNDFLSKYFEEIVNEEFTAKLENELDDVAENDKVWNDLIGDFYSGFEKKIEKASTSSDKYRIKNVKIDELCPECGNELEIKHGRNGKFIGCSNFPDCKYTKAIVKSTGVKCPQCNDGEIIEKVSKRGKVFYGCNNYPECDFALWDKPTGEVCPVCGSLLIHKKNRKMDKVLCINSKCAYEKD